MSMQFPDDGKGFMNVTQTKNDVSEKVIIQSDSPIYVNFFPNDASEIARPEDTNPNRQGQEEYQTLHMSEYKNFCEETNPIFSKSSSDGATYAKYNILNKLGMLSEENRPPNR